MDDQDRASEAPDQPRGRRNERDIATIVELTQPSPGSQETDGPAPDTSEAMSRVEAVIGEHFPEVLGPVKAALAVAAVGCFSDNEQPTTLVLLAPASAGKSMGLNFMTPTGTDDPLSEFFYRSDKFTPASFVTHRADLDEEGLAKIDLLPRLKDRTLISRELAPLFTGKRDELMSTFAILTAVLDGKGYMSDSGAHGQRGYSEPINFQWLGATTPLSPEVLSVMATLGPRIVFYDADRPRQSTQALVAFAQRPSQDKAKEACQEAVRDFLFKLYAQHPPRSLDSQQLRIDARSIRQVVLWAQVLVALRASMSGDSNTDRFETTAVEHPERVLGILKNFALGSALAHGRTEVNEYDLGQVAHIALSSGVAGRQRIFRTLLKLGGSATTPEIQLASRLTAPSVRRYMGELEAVGLGKLAKAEPPRADRVTVAGDFAELAAPAALKAKAGEGEDQC